MFSDLIGKTIIEITGLKKDSPTVIFKCGDGTKYQMQHRQECCEIVTIDDVCGDIDDLLNSPVIKASEDTNSDNPKEEEEWQDESFTWTFYNIATAKGHVTIRWYGQSNGYYSEDVDFNKIT